MKPDISEKEKKVYVTLYKNDAPSYAMILLATGATMAPPEG